MIGVGFVAEHSCKVVASRSLLRSRRLTKEKLIITNPTDALDCHTSERVSKNSISCESSLTLGPPGRLTLTRDLQPELMDDPAIDPVEHAQALAGLARLNQFSGVAPLMSRYVRRLNKDRLLATSATRPLRILDVASGGGDVPIAWARRAKRDGISIELTMIDISPVAVQQQQRLAKCHGINVKSIQMNCLTEALPTGFDLVTNSLFMHHLEVADAAHMLRQMRAATDNAILVCDLERSRFNVALVTIAGQALSRSKVVHHDGPQSVRGAFTRSEFLELSNHALKEPMQVHNAFPCRFIAYHVA